MRHLWLVAAIVLLGIGLYWSWPRFRPEDPMESAPTPKERNELKELLPPAADPPKKIKPARKPKTKTAQPKSKAEEFNEPSPIVGFVVRDGLAVAFGDIVLGTPDEDTLTSGFYEMPKPQYWDKPEIPYAINDDVPNAAAVKQALQHIESKTGLRFVPYDTQPDALLFQGGAEHCESPLGRLGGLQPIRLSKGCGWSEIVHEILHALGFIHEQSRSDRDGFVAVEWNHIEEKYWPQFQKLSEDFLGPLRDRVFDYRSTMLYERDLFAKQAGLITLKTLTPQDIAPSRAGLSDEDALRVKRLFRLD